MALVSTALLGTACSSSSSPAGNDGGGGEAGQASGEAGGAVDAAGEAGAIADASPGDAPGATSDGAGDGAVACNTLANSATAVSSTQVAQNPPALQGGTIAAGTYFLTNLTIYTGPNGPAGAAGSAQTTIQVSAGTIQVSTSGSPATRTEALVTTGIDFTATDTCPDTTVIQGTYTATSTSLVVQFPGGTDDAGPRTVQETFTKQ